MSVKTMYDPDYWTEYNSLLSEVYAEFKGKFGALATPTLSKQETVTSLFRSITTEGCFGRNDKPAFPWRRLFEFVPRLLLTLAMLLYISLRHRIRSLPANAVVFRTWLVPRSFSGEALRDEYFRSLPVDIAAHDGVVISYTPLDVRLIWRFHGKQAKEAKAILSYGLLSITDVLKLFADYVFTGLVHAKSNYYFRGRNVTRYINASLLLDYLGMRSFEAYAEKHKCRKLAKKRIKAFVYVYENQSWEKACCAVLRERGIRVIGYQSSGFSPVFLNFFPTAKDAKCQPMPDVILTVGDHFKRYLLEHGHYDVPIVSFAALRFSYRNEGGRYVIREANRQIVGRVLYAFSVHLDQYAAIINDLIEVFSGTGIGVDLKMHPLYGLRDIKGLPRLPQHFNIVEAVEMNSLQQIYDCVLFNDNSFGIESLLHGVRSFQYVRDGGRAADDRFIYFDQWQPNYSREDLVQMRNAILSGSFEKAFDVRAVSDYIAKMYRPYTADSLKLFSDIVNGNPVEV